MSTWHDISTSSKANSLCKTIQDNEFIMCIFSLNDIICLTRPLSILIQTKNLDLFSATTKIKELREILSTKQNDSNQNVPLRKFLDPPLLSPRMPLAMVIFLCDE